MIRPPYPAWFWALPQAGFRRPLASLAALSLTLGACKENISAAPGGPGPDVSGPEIRVRPAADTLADSTGLLLVTLNVRDASGVKSVDLFLLPAVASFPTQAPLDTAVAVSYAVPLGPFKHGSFRFYARALDLLDHETVTDTVTVTVR